MASQTHEIWLPGTVPRRHQHQPGRINTSSSSGSSTLSASIMHRLNLGSVRNKFSRKNSNGSQKSGSGSASNDGERQSRSLPQPERANNNPFANPSPPTRRPAPIEPPPAYTPSPTLESGPALPASSAGGLGGFLANPSRGVSPSSSIRSAISTAEDPYAFLTTFDTIFLIDDSGSMAGRSWREVKEALRAITPICTAHDADGVDVYFLNHRSGTQADTKRGKAAGGYKGVSDAATVERLFSAVRPGGGTPTGTRLHQILKPYLQLLTDRADNLETVKPINMIVVTDGVPSDDVESILVAAAKKLDKLEAPPYQVGIQFFQVGNEPGAREALRELDDGLGELVEGGIRDMVDTVTWDVRSGGQTPVLTADGILKTVLGAVVRRIDRRRTSGERRRD